MNKSQKILNLVSQSCVLGQNQVLRIINNELRQKNNYLLYEFHNNQVIML
jgi:hypothetical protein